MVTLNFEYVQKCDKKNKFKFTNKTHLFMNARRISKIVSITLKTDMKHNLK